MGPLRIHRLLVVSVASDVVEDLRNLHSKPQSEGNAHLFWCKAECIIFWDCIQPGTGELAAARQLTDSVCQAAGGERLLLHVGKDSGVHDPLAFFFYFLQLINFRDFLSVFFMQIQFLEVDELLGDVRVNPLDLT